jgi:hypothetical protein
VVDFWSLPRVRSGCVVISKKKNLVGLLGFDRHLFVRFKISLKIMQHVNRKLVTNLEIHLFACSFGVLLFLMVCLLVYAHLHCFFQVNHHLLVPLFFSQHFGLQLHLSRYLVLFTSLPEALCK